MVICTIPYTNQFGDFEYDPVLGDFSMFRYREKKAGGERVGGRLDDGS